MEPLALAFVVFFVLALVIGPLLRIEDRPDFLRPDSKARKMVDPSRLWKR